MKNLVIVFFVLLFLSVLDGCKKNSTADDNTVKLSVLDAGKTIAVAGGHTFAITLNNPGDGGYQFNTPMFDAAVIHMDSHTHTPAADTKLVGNFGTDTFNFTPLKPGTTVLSITASRGKVDTVSIFNANLVVK